MPKDLIQSKLTGISGAGVKAPPAARVDPSPRTLRSGAEGGQRWLRASIEGLAGQSVTNAAEGVSHLDLNRLTVPGGATSMDDLAGTLFQISMLPGIRSNKSGVDAIRAVAFILAQAELDSKSLDIAEAVTARVEARLDVLAADAEARVAEASSSLKSQVEAIIKGTVESLQSQLRDDEKWHPIGFTSKSLSPAEHNYTIYDKELLSVIHGLEEWRHILEGTKHMVEILNNHQNLTYFQMAQMLNHCQARWSLYLS